MHRCTGAAQAFGDSPFEGFEMGHGIHGMVLWGHATVPGSKSARNAIADFIPNKQAPRI